MPGTPPGKLGNRITLHKEGREKVGEVARYVSNKNLGKGLQFGNCFQDDTKMSLPVTNMHMRCRPMTLRSNALSNELVFRDCIPIPSLENMGF